MPTASNLPFASIVRRLTLVAALSIVVAGGASAQPVSGSRYAERNQQDAICAAAANLWLIGMPNGTPQKDQMEGLSVVSFYTKALLAAGQAAGYGPDKTIAAIEAFEAEGLPRMKSPDQHVAEKARAQAQAGTQSCAALPEYKDRRDMP